MWLLAGLAQLVSLVTSRSVHIYDENPNDESKIVIEDRFL